MRQYLPLTMPLTELSIEYYSPESNVCKLQGRPLARFATITPAARTLNPFLSARLIPCPSYLARVCSYALSRCGAVHGVRLKWWHPAAGMQPRSDCQSSGAASGPAACFFGCL